MASSRPKASALYSVQRIALAIATQPDDLAQLIHREQVLPPQLVKGTRQRGLLDQPHNIRAIALALRRIVLGSRLGDALQ
jgi:hypothetical protein